jgi:hypothetical protein
MWNTATGQIVWMSHPAWPSFIWQTYTWDYQTPGSYFGVKKASEPLHVQLNLDDRTVTVVNNTRHDFAGLTVRVSFIDLFSGSVIDSSEWRVDAPTAVATSVGKAVLSGDSAALPGLYILRLELCGEDTYELVSVNDYWMAASTESYAAINDIPEAKLWIDRRDGYVIVKNVSNVTAINIKLDAVDSETGEIILPAYFSDGYFNLRPGEGREIDVSIPCGGEDCRIVATGYNI